MIKKNGIVKLWVSLKCFIADLNDDICRPEIEREVIGRYFESVPNYNSLVEMGFKYKADRLGPLWSDYQMDAARFFLVKEGDCNYFNRLIQVAAYILGDSEAFLVTYIARSETPPKNWFVKTFFWWLNMSHGTCIVKRDGKFYSLDYGTLQFPSDTIEECIEAISSRKYDSIPSSYCIQNIDWRFV